MQQTFQCYRCGYQVAFGTRFCGHCGNSLSWQQQTTPQPIDQQPVNYQQQSPSFYQQPANDHPQQGMNWFQRHLNWTYIILFLLFGSFFQIIISYTSPRYQVYLDKVGTTLLDSNLPPDLNNIQWSPRNTANPSEWLTGTLIVYIHNIGNSAFDINASTTKIQDRPNGSALPLILVQPGISMSSDTITVEPKESRPLVITIQLSPESLSSLQTIEPTIYFHVSKKERIGEAIIALIALGIFITACGCVNNHQH